MDNACAARALLATAETGALATLALNGHPFVSFVTLALDGDGTPTFLISKLALHTQNLLRDGRASLLLRATERSQDPLAEHRLTLIGSARQTQSTTARVCFLKRHPTAAQYVDFADFGFFALAVEKAYFIAGFGRIEELSAADILPDQGA